MVERDRPLAADTAEPRPARAASAAVRATIYALSSGSPPAAIAVVRVSGPASGEALRALAGRIPEPRRASLALLRDPATGEELDRALIFHFPGPETATGEDTAEFHIHGGRAVVAAVLAALGQVADLRPATAGEFTRRAFENGRIDLAEAEGLADLLSAETEAQRRAALALAGGALSRRVAQWQQRLLALSSQVEALLDFADEADVMPDNEPIWQEGVTRVATEVRSLLSKPVLERLKDGVHVVIAGPPNAGKSTLLNALAGREAAIISEIAGTTRDVIEAPVAVAGTPLVLTDTAGLRESDDVVEVIGVDRARAALAGADIVLWLGEPEKSPEATHLIRVQPKADILSPNPAADLSVSARTGMGMDRLIELILERARGLLPREGEVAVNARHRTALAACVQQLDEAAKASDALIAAEGLRRARVALDRVTGRAGVEDMLDVLFSRFCIGK